MASFATVNVGATVVELPRGSAAVLTVQNQGQFPIRTTIAASAPGSIAVGPILYPKEWGYFDSFAVGDKVYAVAVDAVAAGALVPVLVQQD